MAKSTATSKQSKKPISDCHCGETKSSAKTKEKKSTKACDCSHAERD